MPWLQSTATKNANGSLAKNGSKRLNARQVVMTATGARPGETLDAASSQGGASANQ